MENENDKVDIVDEDVQEGQDPTEDELNDDTTDWKAKYLQERGIAKRRATKLAKLKEKLNAPKEDTEPPVEPNKSVKSNDLDFGQKAFLKAYDIAGSDELALVKEYLAIGKTIDEIVENKHFTNDLADLREKKATRDATPSASKRGAPSQVGSVEYYLDKPFSEVPADMRTQVLNARLARDSQNAKFTDQPVVNQ